MARKKKEVAQLEAPAEEKPDLKLTEVEILKLKLYESEARRWSLEASLKYMVREEYLRKIDPEGKIQAMAEETRVFVASGSEARAAYNAVMKDISDRLGIDMSKHAYDDVTGMIQVAPE